ncbi:MAG: DNA-processing protein DprA [Patescibacteria group bacterium]|nr:DNA-processing protein DprA [Patescibacteria group bacterium]
MNYQQIKNWKDIPQLELLKNLQNPPKFLYFMGSWNPDLFSSCVAIVGSRRMTSYGRQVVEMIVPTIVQEGKTIVSGFMYGVDQYAHQVCIDHGGKTIAVLGWGIAEPFKDSDERLANAIIDNGGLILSEWEYQKPTLWTFPLRNRIIVGLSQEIIIVEAAAKSGSLITAEIAYKMNKTLYAVPGPITNAMSEGANALIAEGKARLWQPKKRSIPSHQSSNNPILKALETEPLTSNEIARKTGMPIDQVGAELTMLVLCGHVVERDGMYSRAL